VDLDGLWTANFSTGLGVGTGVVTFVDGKLSGGDANYYYIGTCRVQGERITGVLKIVHYAGPLTNLFGPLRELELSLAASVRGDLMIAEARSPAMPGQRLAVKLQRVARLTGEKV
jgi:hypothetical protein